MKKKLHVLFLCSWYPSRVDPLNGDFVQRHAEAVSTNHKVSVLHVISDKNLKKDIEIENNTKNDIKTIIETSKADLNAALIMILEIKKLGYCNNDILLTIIDVIKKLENYDESDKIKMLRATNSIYITVNEGVDTDLQLMRVVCEFYKILH